MYMQQIVTITSQGQITIPASMRRAISLNDYNKALVKTEEKRIIIEPIVDIMSLGGIIKHKRKKHKNINKIIKIEEEVIGKMIR